MYGQDEVFFDPRKVDREEKSGNVVVPPGTYICQIKKSQSKEKNGNMGLMIFLDILCPTSQRGRGLMDYFNLRHSNPQAQKIGEKALAKMLDALGLGREELKNETHLENQVIKCDIGIKAHYKNPQEMQNFVVKYLPLDNADELMMKKAEMAPGANDVPF